jgi:hypothetical protein
MPQRAIQGRHTADRRAPIEYHNGYTIANAGRNCAGTLDTRVRTDKMLQATAQALMCHGLNWLIRSVDFPDTSSLSSCASSERLHPASKARDMGTDDTRQGREYGYGPFCWTRVHTARILWSTAAASNMLAKQQLLCQYRRNDQASVIWAIAQRSPLRRGTPGEMRTESP